MRDPENLDVEDGAEVRSFTVPPEGIDRIDVWLTGLCEDFSRARVQGLMKAGRVTLNGAPCQRGTTTTKPGDIVTLEIPPPVPAEPEPEDIPLSILYEDDDLLALNKPAGLVVHPAPGHLTGTLVNALLHHCPALTGIGGVARPGIVHRLDQDTSGVMIVAKSQRAMDVLTREFASHANIRKTYLALVHGVPSPLQGRIENLIGRCPFDRKKMAVVERNGKVAITSFRVLNQSDLGTQLPYQAPHSAPNQNSVITPVECLIETGRTHQIRVHMASTLGCPIIGDPVYGRQGWDRKLIPVPNRQMLHACRLELKHPVTRECLVLEAPIPRDFLPFI